MRTRNYEAMFLLDNNVASADFEAAAAHVDGILEKHGATLVQKDKWDERKLAYEIKGHRRATYYLVYFTAPPGAIDHIHEDVHLNEVILRHLVLVLELPIEDHIKVRDEERERLAEDSRRNSLSGWGDSRRSRRGAPPPKPKSDTEKRSDEEKKGDTEPAGGGGDAEPAPAQAESAATGSGGDTTPATPTGSQP